MKDKKYSLRNANTTSVGEAISKMLSSYKLKTKFDETKLISSWERLMGKTIASRTKRLFIKNQVLFVELNSAALKHELSMSKFRILDIFKKEFGEGIIEEVVIM